MNGEGNLVIRISFCTGKGRVGHMRSLRTGV